MASATRFCARPEARPRGGRLAPLWHRCARTLGVLSLFVAAACGENEVAQAAGRVGDPDRGQVLLATIGCGACHQIPDVVGASSHIAAPLSGWSQRTYISGMALNSPDNLVRWILNPQQIDPGTAMPNLNVAEGEARDMAAYLYTLR